MGVQTSVAPPPISDASLLRGVSVLVVDDNRTNRKVLEGILSRWGMNPTIVDGGQAALEVMESRATGGHPFPVTIMDGQMPEMDGFTVVQRIHERPELGNPKIVMLTSIGEKGDASRCIRLGVAAYLMKPVRQGELLETMCRVLQNTPETEPPVLVTRHTLREDRSRLSILVAEDNAVNQALIVRLLQKRGYVVTVVPDGRAAIDALAAKPYDVVLMDVQMPVMDGFEATAAIREKEKGGDRRVPIIAMTAHSLKGDQERCLAAGMDGYVSKPIRTAELLTAIECLAGKTISSPAELPVETPLTS
jgi:CheY-like chemotaxis protein